jgi:succinate dehydrogenase/fumarate reductase flavoprotein subunit
MGYANRELSGTAAKGIWVDKDLETDIRNLYAGGDEVGGMPWAASPGAFTMGWHAGDMAAQRARKQTAHLDASDELVRTRRDGCSQILNRDRGFCWKEVELYIQNVTDFYCGDVRGESLLKRGLERLDYAKRAPLKADNPHELARALEVQSIADNVELIIRSSIERKESRASFEFRRAEYPEQDDQNWLCFLAARRDQDGRFTFNKLPVDR